jgi:hypothetical protein
MVVPGTRINVQGNVAFRDSMSVSAVKKAYLSLAQRRLKPSDTFVGRLSISGYIILRYTSCMKGSFESCNTRGLVCVNVSLFSNVMDVSPRYTSLLYLLIIGELSLNQ